MTQRDSVDRPRIVVTGELPPSAVALLRDAGEVWVPDHDAALAPAALHAAAAGADALVTLLHDSIDDALLEAAGRRLRCVANVAVGYDNIDVAAATRRGVTVTNTPGVLTDATADLAMALILMTTRRLGEGERLLRARRPWSWQLDFLLGTGLQGKTLGIVGLGAIGTATARRARAFGMRIVYATRTRAPADVERELEADRLPLDDLFATADVVSLHVPLSEQTRHLVDADRLTRMKPSAHLINTTRGPVVDEAALAAALRDGVIAGAALDVFEYEPEVHPGLLDAENAVVVPHLGSATIETRTAMAELAARNAIAVLAGREPLTPVRA